jgi:hypothetical protein
MHTYEALWSDDTIDDLPSITEFRFRCALDVVSWAQLDRTIGWKTWPEVWHLDDGGVFQCYQKGSSLESLTGWADDPQNLFRSRWEGLALGGCASRWLIIESRPLCMYSPPTVTEADVAAFESVRRSLASLDVDLVDAMVFDDARHWWSINELLTGSTTW